MTSEMVQGSLEWHLARVGRVTASNAWKLLDRTQKGLPTAEYTNFKWQLVIERLTGNPTDTYVNAAMQWGTDHEAGARAFYSELNEVEVEEVGFMDHPTLPYAGCSPDGLVAHDGLVELKCPTTRNFLEIKLSGEPPKNYFLQVQFQLMCTERDWGHLAFYDPRLPEDLQFFQYFIDADHDAIRQLEEATIAINAEVDAIITNLKDQK
jgi:putative phage-type endonuclease